MTVNHQHRGLVLVLEDVRETATLIRSLLIKSGFSVVLAEDEQAAIMRARLETPDVLLICLGLATDQLVSVADRIRDAAELGGNLPMVVSCTETLPEGLEVKVCDTTYLVRPDDFDQLRRMLARLASVGTVN